MSDILTKNGTAAAGLLARFGHVPISLVPIDALKTHPLNDRLYRPIGINDPDIAELAESIRTHKLQEALIVTRDLYVLSGNRRRAAFARLAALEPHAWTVAPCRVVDLHSTDDDFAVLLRENNRQRVKTFAEVVREQVIDADPEEAYRRLVRHRRRAAEVEVDTIEIVGEKRRAAISKAKEPMLAAVQRVLTRRRRFWPLTDRVVHYALLDDPPLRHASKPGSRYQNSVTSYKDLTDLLTRARIAGLIPWESVDDPTRPITTWAVHREPSAFIRRELGGLLKGYYRDLMQSQPNHVEIVIEKNTLDAVVRPVAADYTIPLTSGRGYSSSPPRQKMAQRFERSGKEKLVVLMLGDFDPEGEDIPHSFARSMRDDFLIDDVVPVKVALTGAQVAEMRLPPQMKAKEKSSRRAGFVEAHGEDVFELEAVPPERLQAILREAIDSVIEVGAFNHEIDREREDAARLDTLRRAVRRVLQESDLAGDECVEDDRDEGAS
jgi:ParB-like chromosome segregation protein Spo0J